MVCWRWAGGWGGYTRADAPGCDTVKLVLATAYGRLLLRFADPLISPVAQTRLEKEKSNENHRVRVCVYAHVCV